MLLSLQDVGVQQSELALEDDEFTSRDAESPGLMQMLDSVNKRYGRGSVLMASTGLAGKDRGRSMRQNCKTPGYTTDWNDLALVST